MSIAALVFLAIGVLFGILGSIGVITFPDVYTRLHASSKCSTTAVVSVLIAALFLSGFSAMTGRLLVILLFFLITSPIGAHIIGHRAWSGGVIPWRKSERKNRD